MKVATFKETKVRIPVSRIERLFELVVAEEADPDWPGQVNLVFTTDHRMREHNRRYRAKDSTTDVLAFKIDPPELDSGVFGEIYISAPLARRQATDGARTLSQELLHLTCHGLLHLFGYDHQNEAEARRMDSRQDYYLDRLKGVDAG